MGQRDAHALPGQIQGECGDAVVTRGFVVDEVDSSLWGQPKPNYSASELLRLFSRL
jgi:hypothetical protein